MTRTTKHWSLATIGVALTALLTVFGMVWAASADRASTDQQLEQQSIKIADHEARLRVQESRLGEIAGDVKWIRESLEGKRQ